MTYVLTIVLPSQSAINRIIRRLNQTPALLLTFYVDRVLAQFAREVVVVRRQRQYRSAIEAELQVFDFEF